METIDWLLLKRELKEQWRLLWRDRFDDKVRAEGIASQDYPYLFLERGVVIVATRDYRPPSFREILEVHLSSDVVGLVDPSPVRGGVGKFIREVIMKEVAERRKRSVSSSKALSGKGRQLKKGGRGWLHFRFSR